MRYCTPSHAESAPHGVRVTIEHGRWLLRTANTQTMLVARCEASDGGGLKQVREEFLQALQAAAVEPPGKARRSRPGTKTGGGRWNMRVYLWGVS